jgi:hypothetical protein
MIAEEFIRRAHELHGDIFDYSLVRYRTARRRVKIICPVHGVFEQPPMTHLKAGCRKCADDALPGAYSFKRMREDPDLAKRRATLYYARFHRGEETFYKIGITLTTITARLGAYRALGYDFTVKGQRHTTLRKALTIEQTLIDDFVRKYRYAPRRSNKYGGRTRGHKECFSRPLTPSLLMESGIG